MLSKDHLRQKALKLGFGDAGFTTAEPFHSPQETREAREDEYSFLNKILHFTAGTDPRRGFPEARSLIVLLEDCFLESFPPAMEAHFGRCYQDDDCITKDKLYLKVKAFRGFLREDSIEVKVPSNIPQRMSAARAGVAREALLRFSKSSESPVLDEILHAPEMTSTRRRESFSSGQALRNR